MKIRLFSFVALLAWSPLIGDLSVQSIDRVYDGDTITVTLKDDLPDIFGKGLSIRVYGIDTPEIRSKSKLEKEAAIKVRDFVRDILENAESITLTNEKRGKYFRVVANVIVNEKYSLTDILLKFNLAKPYFGKTKTPWTDEELHYIIDSCHAGLDLKTMDESLYNRQPPS